MTTLNLILKPQNLQSNLVYYPGHSIKGTVELSLECPKKFRGLYIKIHGQARAHWTETETTSIGSGENRRTTTHTVHFEGIEVYLNSKTYIFGQRGGESFEISNGIHKYDFECQLPAHLPYSMDVPHGRIEYYVEAVLDIPWRFDKEVKYPFTVLRNDDLNLYPELHFGQNVEEVKTFCCLFCESGPLFFQASIPYTGFARGEKIPFQISYVNKSDVDVLRTRIKLKRFITYTSRTPHNKTKLDRNTMVAMEFKGVKAGESEKFECPFEIPKTVMNSNTKYCQVIRVEYVVKVHAEVTGFHLSPDVSFPIVIGTLPISSGLNNQFAPVVPTAPVVQPSAPVVPIAPVVQPSAPDMMPPVYDLPPSFDEAIKMENPENSALITQPSSAVGWNVLVPSAPNLEKS